MGSTASSRTNCPIGPATSCIQKGKDGNYLGFIQLIYGMSCNNQMKNWKNGATAPKSDLKGLLKKGQNFTGDSAESANTYYIGLM